MKAVAGEVNQMDVEYGKYFKILLPNDQIKGETSGKHISFPCLRLQFFFFVYLRAANDFARQKHQQK